MTAGACYAYIAILRAKGYTGKLFQFSPDASGWGIDCDGARLRTVSEAKAFISECSRPLDWFHERLARDAR